MKFLKELLDETPFRRSFFELTVSEFGILLTLLFYFLWSLIFLIGLPLLPFYLFNCWSKSWFDEEVSGDV